MRLFVAVPLPPAVRAAVATACAVLRETLPPARWVSVERWHVTLGFLGETPPQRVEALIAGLRSNLAAVSAFEAELGGGGSFPARREARVVWIGIVDAAAWPVLAAALQRTTLALGWAPEGRPFSPHVTVARPRRPWPRTDADRWRQSVPKRLGGPFMVSEAVLYRSELAPREARHHAIAQLPLGGAR